MYFVLFLLVCRFYFPGGKPVSLSQLEMTMSKITAAFQNLANCRATRAQFYTITKVRAFPIVTFNNDLDVRTIKVILLILL